MAEELFSSHLLASSEARLFFVAGFLLTLFRAECPGKERILWISLNEGLFEAGQG